MCGRFKVVNLRDYFKAIAGFTELQDGWLPRYNIAPSQAAAIVRADKENQPVLSLVNWGLIPSWTKGQPKNKPINARCETVATSPMFRSALERRRCLVPADGFYEWKGAKPPKQPYLIHMKGDAIFAFGGLWERWQDGDAEPVDTFTIITTSPNELMKPIHNRMPVILDQADYQRWLDRNIKAADVADLIKPFDADRMTAYPVSSKVNSPRNDDPSLIEPVASI